MSKKILMTLSVAVLAISLSGCGNKKENDTTTEDKVTGENNNTENSADDTENTTKTEESVDDTSDKAVGVLNKILSLYDEDEKFPIVGGDTANSVTDAPGVHSMEDKESMNAMLHLPLDIVDRIDDVASMIHMMNANTFTGCAVHVKEGEDVKAVAEAIKTNIEGTQWICGFPSKLVIAEVSDNNLVYFFGEETIMETFDTKLREAYDGAKVLYEVALDTDF